jgi:hypothetical protein
MNYFFADAVAGVARRGMAEFIAEMGSVVSTLIIGNCQGKKSVPTQACVFNKRTGKNQRLK